MSYFARKVDSTVNKLSLFGLYFLYKHTSLLSFQRVADNDKKGQTEKFQLQETLVV